MNILIINGSPKGAKSNTYKLTTAFLEGMKEELSITNTEIQVKNFSVSRLDIKPCLGCFSCWNRTPGHCCIQDDMSQMIEALLWADITLWSFPLYYFTVPGPLKNLIDRQLPMELPFMTENENLPGNGSHPSRYDMSGKKTVVISTCGFYTAEGNYDGVHSIFDHQYGPNGYTSIFCGQGELFRVPEVSGRTEEYLSYVRQAGQEYIRDSISPETQSRLNQLLFPKETFEAWADASWGIDQNTTQKESDTLTFTRQMAALYQKESYTGKSLVLEMYYTDVDECYQILLGKDGSHVYTDGSLTATTRIETPVSLWRSIAAGKIRGDEALMQQLYRVKGDFNLMINWDTYFGNSGQQNTKTAAPTQKSTTMLLLLLPWIVFWSAAAIDKYWGCLASIGVCALLPLFFWQNKKTLYDILSNTLITAISAGMLAGAGEKFMLPLSYLAFGIMWTVSCFGKIPLTANYSMNSYGGEKILKNPLFLKTNRILTLLWGILYLFTAVLTYFIMGTPMSRFTGIFNSVLPFFMGLFTVWFQKWYPARVARGNF